MNLDRSKNIGILMGDIQMNMKYLLEVVKLFMIPSRIHLIVSEYILEKMNGF